MSTTTTLYDLVRRQAVRRPGAPAFIFKSITTSYGEVDAEVQRVSRGLSVRGVGRGDRVLVLAGNVPEVVILYLAACRLGAVYVPVSAGFKEREVSFILENAE